MIEGSYLPIQDYMIIKGLTNCYVYAAIRNVMYHQKNCSYYAAILSGRNFSVKQIHSYQ